MKNNAKAKTKTKTRSAAKAAPAKTAKSNAKPTSGSGKNGKAKGKPAATTGKDQVFRVASFGGQIETIGRAEAVKDVVSGGVFDEKTTNEMLDTNDTAFSNDFYYSLDRANLAKWETKAGPTDAEKKAANKKMTVEAFRALKAKYPGEVKDTYATKDEADHAFMLGDDTAQDRIESGNWFSMKENDPFSVTEISLDDIRANVGKKYTGKRVTKWFEDGMIFTGNDGLRFGPNRDALLADYEKRTGPQPPDADDETPAPLTGPNGLKAGDVVRNIVTKAEGVVVEKKGALHVETPKVKGGLKLVDLTDAWTITEAAPEGSTAITKVEPAPIEVRPMTAKDTARLAKLETAVVKAKDALENAPMVMGAALNEIRQDKLFRETAKADGSMCKTFGEYAEFKFGITREYAQNIAQISGFMDIANEAIEGGKQLVASVNVANTLVRDMNKLGAALGIGRVEAEALKPMIVATTALLVDIAPKDDDGNPVISPRLVDSFNETLRSHIHDGVVEIDGKQMTLAAAKEKGLLNASLRDEVLASAAEGIRTNAATIRAEAEKAYERQNEPVSGGGDKTGADKPQYFTGTPPTLSVDCSKHGTKPIVAIGNGRFQTACKCRWHIDADSGDLVCFEVNGKRVKRS